MKIFHFARNEISCKHPQSLHTLYTYMSVVVTMKRRMFLNEFIKYVLLVNGFRIYCLCFICM